MQCMSHEMSRAACLQCTTAFCLCIICGHLWLMESAKRGRGVHWGNVPLYPSLVFIMVIIYLTVWTRRAATRARSVRDMQETSDLSSPRAGPPHSLSRGKRKRATNEKSMHSLPEKDLGAISKQQEWGHVKLQG